MRAPTITHLDTRIVDVPFRCTHHIAGRDVSARSLLIVKLTTSDGVQGLGEGTAPCGLGWSSETVETMDVVVQRYLRPAIEGLAITDLTQIESALDAVIQGHRSAKGAVSDAALDALARTLGVRVVDLLGGAVRDWVPASWLLSGHNPVAVAEEIAIVSQSTEYSSFTLPIDGASSNAAAFALAVAQAVEPGVRLTIDVRGGWPRYSALFNAHDLSDAGVWLIEQPTRPGDWETSAKITASIPVSIAADESVASPRDAMEVGRHGSADVLTLISGKCGGARSMSAVAHVAAAADLGCRVGTWLEGQIGAAMALQVACALPDLAFGADFYGPLLLADPLVARPLDYSGGGVRLPSGPGIGVEIDDAAMRQFARA